jgi:putative aldouronate transport system permease protein
MKSRRLGSGINRTEPIVYVFYVIVILVSLLCLLPFWLVVIGSLSSESDILKYGYALWPRNWSLAAYEMVFNIPGRIIQAYKVSIIITFVGTFISLVFSSMAAFVLMRKDFVYRNKIAMFLYFPSIFSGGMLPSYLLITKYLGLKDNIWALILPGMISAWNIFLLRNFMTDIPDSIAESAKIDGANDFQIFTKFYLPLSKAGLATIGLFTALGYWNSWSGAMLYINKQDLYPLQYLLYSMLSNVQGLKELASAAGIALPDLPGETYKMAMAVVTTGPILLLYPFVQRYFVKGLTVGSVKG